MKDKSKKKKLLKIILMTLCLVVIVGVVCYAPSVLADVGNNNRYEGGSSSGSIDLEGMGEDEALDILYLIYILLDVFGPVPTLIIVIVVGAIAYFTYKKRAKKKKINLKDLIEQTTTDSETTINNTTEVANKVRATDPAFSEDAFIGWVREVFIKIQTAWTKREWNIIRPFESNELFSQHNTQLQEYIDNNKINVVEKINISYCALRDFRVDGDKEVMEVELHAIMRDYVIDATTRNVLESNPNKDWNMKYIMTFNRKVGVKTKPGTSNKSTTNCPNCGAPTKITSSGQCDYCESVITTGEHDWVLSDIRSK